MYEQFKNQFMLRLSGNFANEELEVIMEELDKTAYDYEIKKRETELVVYNDEMPALVKTYLVCKKIEGLFILQKINYEVAHERDINVDIHNSSVDRTWIHSLAFKKTKERPGRANNRGTMLLLRVQLIEYHDKYMEQGNISSYAYDNFIEM